MEKMCFCFVLTHLSPTHPSFLLFPSCLLVNQTPFTCPAFISDFLTPQLQCISSGSPLVSTSLFQPRQDQPLLCLPPTSSSPATPQRSHALCLGYFPLSLHLHFPAMLFIKPPSSITPQSLCPPSGPILPTVCEKDIENISQNV